METNLAKSNIEERYNKWFNELDCAARETIGKTTFNVRKKLKISQESRQIQNEKRSIKKTLKNEIDKERR